MSDQDYEAFLNKASSDAQPSAFSKSASKSRNTVTTSSSHPALSLSQDRVYTTDADEPFRPVSIPYSESDLTTKGVSAAIKSATGESVKGVEEISIADWDPRGEYRDVIDKVGEAVGGKKNVKIYREDLKGSRIEYWIVGLESEELRGFAVTGVES